MVNNSGTGIVTWSAPPDRPTLVDGQVHIWSVGLERINFEGHSLSEVLSADERERAERYRFDKDRKHFIAARGSLRIILAKYLACLPDEIVFAYGEQGKPSLAHPRDEVGINFNVSHSTGLALIGVCRGSEIGVDVEHKSRRVGQMDQVAKRFFAGREYDAIRTLQKAEQIDAFFNCWTRKEAFVKAVGSGLAHSLKEFEVSVDHKAQLLQWVDGEVSQWRLQHLDLGDGYVGAIAIQAQDVEVVCWGVDDIA